MRDVRSKYPRVAQLPVRELASWLQDPARARPVILDVRERAEFEVSHLPGAHRATSLDAALDVIAELPADAPVVAYCAVGYRSSALAQELMAHGYTNVQNLEGSIFEWANRGHPVVRAGREVREVHPYSWWWGRYLNESRRAR